MNRIVWSLAAAAALLIPVVGTAETVGGKVEKSRDGWSEVVDHVVDTQLGGTLSLVVETGGIEVETWGKKQVRAEEA